MKKLTIILTMAFCTCLAAFALVGCGGGNAGGGGSAEPAAPSDEEMITELLSAASEGFDEGMEKVKSGEAFEGEESMTQMFAAMGITSADFGEALAQHMALEIGEIKIDGDEATGELIFKAPDFEALDPLTEEAIGKVDTTGMTDEEIAVAYGKVIMEVLNTSDLPQVSNTVEVELEKVDGEWTIKNPEVLEAAFASITESMG